MSRTEYEAMVATGRVQPNLDGREMKHFTSPPDPDSFRAADPGSVFVEFAVEDTQVLPGGHQDWFIVYGPNSVHGRNAIRKGVLVMPLPAVSGIIITEIKQQ